MRRNSIIAIITMALAFPGVLWLTGQVGAKGFDKPSLPQGAHLVGPAAKGTLTFTVNGTVGTVKFEGRCSNNTVSSGDMDVSQLTDATAFLAATDKQVADSIEGWTLFAFSYPTQIANFSVCYGDFLGMFVTAVNKSLSKTSLGPGAAVWVGEVTLQGFKF